MPVGVRDWAAMMRRPPAPEDAALPGWVRAGPGAACLLQVAVVPGAARSEVVGEHDGCLRVRVASPPVDGRANDALRRALADWLDLPLRAIQLERGAASRRKTLRIEESAAVVAARLDPHQAGADRTD